MNRRQKLLDDRAKLWSEAQDIRQRAESASRDLTREEDAEFSRALDQVERIDAQLDHQFDGSTDTRAVRPGGAPSVRNDANEFADGMPLPEGRSFVDWVQHRAAPRPDDEPQPELSLRKYLRGLATGDWQGAQHEHRAMAEGALGTGGYMVPALLSAQIIDLARAQTRVLQAGARIFPMANKKVTVAKWAQDPGAAWHSEGAAISPSDGALGSIELNAQTLAGLTVASRELLEDADGVEDELRQAFAATFRQKVDQAGLYGTGTEPEPRGVKNTSGVTIQSTGANGATPANYGFLVDAVGAIQDANEDPNAVILAPRTERTIAGFADTTGQPLQAPAMLQGLPRYPTTQIPTDLTVGTSTDTSDVFVGDWRQLYIGVRTELQIQVLRERYADTGQVGFLTWWRGDVAVARPKAFTVVTGVRNV